MPRSTVIIPAFNQATVTVQCLKALVGHIRAEIIVVDDGSTDATVPTVERMGDRVKLMRRQANEGFAIACNEGAAAAASTEFLVFLNNDTIPQPGWLEALEAHADRHPQAAVVGAKLLYPDRTIQHAGVVICQDRYPRHLYTGFPADHPAVSKSRRFQIVTAACLLVRRPAFERAQGFDSAFRNGFEDVDLCLRLGDLGHEVHYCAESVLTHLESVSPGRFKDGGRNVALYRERWMERVKADDVDYYVQDGLLEVDYEGRYPIGVRMSPLLATIDEGAREAGMELVLRQRSREVMELERENTRLMVALGESASHSAHLRYQRLRQEIREAVRQTVPAGSTVLVISRGDSRLLDLPNCTGWHFPQDDRGAYAGHHPASSEAAVAHLQALQAKGADYLLIPATAGWWLEHYAGLHRHLERCGERIQVRGEECVIYRLDKAMKPEVIHAH
jgi:GT2 family glycosyltransferase